MRMYPVIMAGGSGTRFWPLSRQARPKQFLPLTSKNPLIVETQRRLGKLATSATTYVVCGARHAPQVKKHLPKIPKANVLVEPEARNTAPAIALAVAAVRQRDPQGLMVVLPSDQHVADTAGFQAALQKAAAVAQNGSIVTLGITPHRPETGYGYIRVGTTTDGATAVAAFVEKPSLEKAQAYLSEGGYLWNAGIFVFRADVMFDAFRTHMPELFAALEPIAQAWGTRKQAAAVSKHFKRMPSTSIDYGIAEKFARMAVVPGDFGWSDVGSFNALPEVRPVDTAGNVLDGPGAMAIDAKGCVIVARERPVAIVGMTDVVVVDAGDAILVIPKDKSQDVRKVIEALKAKKSLQPYL
jgi:mannose-1-phosphate guanylyltransferase